MHGQKPCAILRDALPEELYGIIISKGLDHNASTFFNFINSYAELQEKMIRSFMIVQKLYHDFQIASDYVKNGESPEKIFINIIRFTILNDFYIDLNIIGKYKRLLYMVKQAYVSDNDYIYSIDILTITIMNKKYPNLRNYYFNYFKKSYMEISLYKLYVAVIKFQESNGKTWIINNDCDEDDIIKILELLKSDVPGLKFSNISLIWSNEDAMKRPKIFNYLIENGINIL